MKNKANSTDAVMPPEGNNRILMRDGTTTYILNLHFRTDATDSLEDKVKKMIRKDVSAGNF